MSGSRLLVTGATYIAEVEMPAGNFILRLWENEDVNKLYESNDAKPTQEIPVTGGEGIYSMAVGSGCAEAIKKYLRDL